MFQSTYFKQSEFACRCGCGYQLISPALVKRLDELREYVGVPIRINSGCRCPKHNASVNGRPHSYHMVGRAADITFMRPLKITRNDLVATLIDIFPGVIEYATFFHVDNRQVPFHQFLIQEEEKG